MFTDEVLVLRAEIYESSSIQDTVVAHGDRSRSSTPNLQPPERHAFARLFVGNTLDRYRR